MVKLSLYRHFTNTLIFSVMASTAFMFYSMHYNRKEYCTPVRQKEYLKDNLKIGEIKFLYYILGLALYLV